MVLAPARTFVLKFSIRMVAGFLGIMRNSIESRTYAVRWQRPCTRPDEIRTKHD